MIRNLRQADFESWSNLYIDYAKFYKAHDTLNVLVDDMESSARYNSMFIKEQNLDFRRKAKFIAITL